MMLCLAQRVVSGLSCFLRDLLACVTGLLRLDCLFFFFFVLVAVVVLRAAADITSVALAVLVLLDAVAVPFSQSSRDSSGSVALCVRSPAPR